jgi:hypothetical protein
MDNERWRKGHRYPEEDALTLLKKYIDWFDEQNQLEIEKRFAPFLQLVG